MLNRYMFELNLGRNKSAFVIHWSELMLFSLYTMPLQSLNHLKRTLKQKQRIHTAVAGGRDK